MEKQAIIDTLNAMAHDWYSSSQADALHEAYFKNLGYTKFAARCAEEAEEELEQAKKCTQRVVELGGKPVFGFTEQPIFDDPKALLEDWDKATEEGIAELNKIAQSIENDAVTKRLVEDFVAGEEEHHAWVHRHLAIIDKVGYDNYLLEQMEL